MPPKLEIANFSTQTQRFATKIDLDIGWAILSPSIKLFQTFMVLASRNLQSASQNQPKVEYITTHACNIGLNHFKFFWATLALIRDVILISPSYNETRVRGESLKDVKTLEIQ